MLVSIANRRSVMTLFSEPACFQSHRTRIVIAEKDIVVDIVNVDANNRPEDLAELNPYGVLPTLVDRDLVLYDARIIMDYLDERFPHPPLLPVDPVTRASCRLALYRIEQDWYPLAQKIADFDPERATYQKQLAESIASIAPIFKHTSFFLTDDFSLVDASIAPILWRLPDLGVELPKAAKAVEEYGKRLFDRDGFRLSLSEIEYNMR